MRAARAWLRCAPTAAIVLLAFASARAEEAPRDCLPVDLKLRVAFAEPKRLAEALKEIDAERKRAGRHAVLKRRFEEAGCGSVEEQSGAGFAEPNLICRIPGRSADTIAIGSSPMFDGWAAAALLPEIARAVAASPREHGYAIAVLSRGATSSPVGSRAFAESFGERQPRLFLHVGTAGSQLPEIGPEASEQRRCEVESIAQATLGTPLQRVRGWDQVSAPCLSSGGNRYSGGTDSLRTCQSSAYSRGLDVDPFVQRDVAVVGLYAYPKRDKTNFSMPPAARLDAAAYVASYRVLAAYAVALDSVLAAPAAGEDSPAVSETPAAP